MRVIRDIDELRQAHGGSFVPTMGALHEGHLSLIRQAATLGMPAVVSIFVNPTQFGPGEDFQEYPRDLDADVARAEAAGASVVFAPDVVTMYPAGADQSGSQLPPVATQPALEDRHRPGHLAGVCQVVARLFDLVRPGVAVFGEKDYQQLRVIQQMVQTMRDAQPQRWGELRIASGPTVREPDGLALSSRNAYLNAAQRTQALGLSFALNAAHTLLNESTETVSPDDVESTMKLVLDMHHVRVDYAVVRDAATLEPVENLAKSTRALIAAHVDHVRLIDNAALRRPSNA
jgi:pantoate--beta-alanine ligase